MDLLGCVRQAQVVEPIDSSMHAHKQKSALKKGRGSCTASVALRDLHSTENPGKERDLIVKQWRKSMFQAKLSVVQFLNINGFRKIDTNCPKRVRMGLGVTYPLHVAATQNDHCMVLMLLHFGADPLQKDSWGRTAHCCTQSKQVQELLEKHGGGTGAHGLKRPFRNHPPVGFEDFFEKLENDPLVQRLKQSRRRQRRQEDVGVAQI
mmetsp:Transcript_36794/g.68492  ORF Transcript_36794/g.68492 Transcript_36794/m.68492 type:complete len:207 (+) Transcript_36794:102-722(+)